MKQQDQVPTGSGYQIQLETIHSGFSPTHCWVHPRAGVVPGEVPAIVLTMQVNKLTGSDVFGVLNEMRTHDMGKTWVGPIEHDSLGRRQLNDGIEVAISDFTPTWHAATGKLLGTGHTVAYKGDQIHRPVRDTVYSVYDEHSYRWSDWKTVAMPRQFLTSGAGCTQRVDLENGDILLPVYYTNNEHNLSRLRLFATVLKCRFDGQTLRYVEHGTELQLDRNRGYTEPSLTWFKGEFFLTLRSDDHGAVARSADGLQYSDPQVWKWDDGTNVPTYNTQQHWVTHSDRLFLVYTRVAEHNGHVFRHRAPLFMAEVDPVHLCLIRDTETILVPDRGAGLGNFGVVNVNERETWVTTSEWMQSGGEWGQEMMRKLRERFPEEELEPLADTPYMSAAIHKYGSDNAVLVARILWDDAKG